MPSVGSVPAGGAVAATRSSPLSPCGSSSGAARRRRRSMTTAAGGTAGRGSPPSTASWSRRRCAATALVVVVLGMLPATSLGAAAHNITNKAAPAPAADQAAEKEAAWVAATCGLEQFNDYVHAFDKRYSGPAEFDARYAAWRKSCVFVEGYKREHPEAAFEMALNHLSDRTEAEHKRLFGGGDKGARFRKRQEQRQLEEQQQRQRQVEERQLEEEEQQPQPSWSSSSPSWAKRLLQGFRKRDRSPIREVDPNDLEWGPVIEPRALPQAVDWRTPNLNPKGVAAVTPVKNQGLCGACWAFATAAAIEGAVSVLTGYLNEVSVQQLIDCVTQNEGCDGGDFDYAFAYAAKKGLPSYSAYRFMQQQGPCRAGEFPVVSKIDNAYETAVCRTSDLMDKVAQRPVAAAIDGSCDAFVHYSGGIFTASCGRDLNHAVTIVGYGTDAATGTPYWLIKNSWGKQWGTAGYGKMARGVGSCGVSQLEEYAYYAVGGKAFVNGTAIFAEDELANDPHGSFLDRLLQWKYLTVVLGVAIAFLAFPIIMSCFRSLARCCCGTGAGSTPRDARRPPLVVPVTGAGGGRSPGGGRRSPNGGSGYPGGAGARSPPGNGRAKSPPPMGSGGGGGSSPRASPGPSSPPPSAPPALGSEWSCSSCTFMNPPHKRMCQICGQYRLA